MALLRHLALRCQDMDRSRKFYEDVIGWKSVGFRPSGNVDLGDGVNNITLIQQPEDMVRPNHPEEGNEYIHFGVIVEDLQAVWERAESWGAELSKDDVKGRNPIDKQHPPQESFKVLDPDGNVVDVTCNKEEWKGVSV